MSALRLPWNVPVLFLCLFISDCASETSVPHEEPVHPEFTTMTSTTYFFKPVTISMQELHSSFRVLPSREMESPGKILLSGNLLFVNEKYQGIHVIDIADPSSPKNLAFLYIPGNLDIHLKDNTLYADSYVDLVAIAIAGLPGNPSFIRERERVLSVFPKDNGAGFAADFFKKSHMDFDPRSGSSAEIEGIQDLQGRFIVNLSFTRKEVHTFQVPWGARFGSFSENAPSVSGAAVGSQARFAIAGNYLYTVDQKKLHVFEIGSARLAELGTIDVALAIDNVASGFLGIDTLFSHEGFLYIGSNLGMGIFSISGNPAKPAFVSFLAHPIRRDPVVVEGDVAYASLRDGQLLIIDIANKAKPVLRKTYSLGNASGLAVEKDLMILCMGDSGYWSIYDVSGYDNIKKLYLGRVVDPQSIAVDLRSRFYDLNCYDCIKNGDQVIVTTSGGILFMDITDPTQPKLLGYVPAKQIPLGFEE